MLTLTRDLPKEPGWYWMRCPWLGFPDPEPTQVVVRPGHSYLAICAWTGSGKRDFLPVAKVDAEWAGPLTPPASNKV